MIGSLWDFGEEDLDEATDEKRGLQILESYHAYMYDQFSPDYRFRSVDDLLAHYGSHGALLADNLGMNQRFNNLSLDEAKTAMERLGDAGGGMIPAGWMVFGNALSNEALNPSFWDALQFTVTESAADLKDPLVGAGEGVLATLKAGKYTLPILLWGGAAMALYFTAKGFGKSSERIGTAVAKSTEELGRAAASRLRKK